MNKIRYRAVNQSTGRIVADNVTIADTPISRAVGLLNRSSIAANEGLLIRPCSSVHTFFMKFAIDVVFLDKKGNVLKIADSLKPWRMSFVKVGGYTVLELEAGLSKLKGISIGNTIAIEK